MEAAPEFRMSDKLTPDILGMIFSKLSLNERLRVIPRVCKTWKNIIDGPYCWREIDIVDWSSCCEPRHIERMVEMLVTRSSGSPYKLCVSGLQTERISSFISENAASLQTLRLPRSNINDYGVEQITGKLSMVSTLDLSYCIKIGANTLEIIGKNCKVLEIFSRNMHPSDTYGKPPEDVEAFAIASTMPNLKRLEMTYHRISDDSVHQILSLSPKLEYLDMRGCWSVTLDSMFLKQNFHELKVLGPQLLDYDWDDCLYISDSSDLSDMDDESDDSYDDESESSVDVLEFRGMKAMTLKMMEWIGELQASLFPVIDAFSYNSLHMLLFA